MRYLRDHILGQARRLFRQTFPERQIFFRARGEVRFVRLSPAIQACGVLVIAGALLWTAVATMALLGRDSRLVAREGEIAHATRELHALMAELERLEDEALARTEALEARQALIERIAVPAAVMPPEAAGDATVIPYLPARSDSPAETAPPSAVPRKGAALMPTAQRGLIDSLIGVGRASAANLPPSVFAARRIDELLGRLDDLEGRQTQAALDLATEQAQALDERRAVFARLSLSLESLTGMSLDAGTAMGGPFIADPQDATEVAFSLLSERADMREKVDRLLLSMPSTVPVKKYYVSSGFGRRIDPFHKTRAMHSGLDMAGWAGEPILAAGAGKVIKAGRAPAYGNMIEIDHGNGFRTRYGHMRKLAVKSGDRVEAGQKIGEMGASGRATSTHLHWEIWFRGKLLDPQPFIEASEDVHALQQEARRYEKG